MSTTPRTRLVLLVIAGAMALSGCVGDDSNALSGPVRPCEVLTPGDVTAGGFDAPDGPHEISATWCGFAESESGAYAVKVAVFEDEESAAFGSVDYGAVDRVEGLDVEAYYVESLGQVELRVDDGTVVVIWARSDVENRAGLVRLAEMVASD